VTRPAGQRRGCSCAEIVLPTCAPGTEGRGRPTYAASRRGQRSCSCSSSQQANNKQVSSQSPRLIT